MPKKDHLSGLADLGQEAGSSQLQSFITVHRHTMVWVPSLPQTRGCPLPQSWHFTPPFLFFS